mmetsp:Transcript_122068/g.345212  ORF Transcript_122068/g.345212 Transcript_122068/m.345212 type:complete len:240 (+) Transcript_122068:2817-3536(+)
MNFLSSFRASFAYFSASGCRVTASKTILASALKPSDANCSAMPSFSRAVLTTSSSALRSSSAHRSSSGRWVTRSLTKALDFFSALLVQTKRWTSSPFMRKLVKKGLPRVVLSLSSKKLPLCLVSRKLSRRNTTLFALSYATITTSLSSCSSGAIHLKTLWIAFSDCFQSAFSRSMTNARFCLRHPSALSKAAPSSSDKMSCITTPGFRMAAGRAKSIATGMRLVTCTSRSLSSTSNIAR